MIGWGFLGCDASINESTKNIQKENNYVQLAKKFERMYLQKFQQKDSAYMASAKFSKKELKKMAQKYNFDEEKIANYRKEILQIAKSYGFERKDFNLRKYFFINPITGETFDKDYYKMFFAYVKHLKVKLAPRFKKNDKINNRITALTKKYNTLIKKAETKRERRKLQEEYLKKVDKLNDAYR